MKDLLHYLVVQIKYFQATGYTGDCYIWRSFEGGDMDGTPSFDNSNN